MKKSKIKKLVFSNNKKGNNNKTKKKMRFKNKNVEDDDVLDSDNQVCLPQINPLSEKIQ